MITALTRPAPIPFDRPALGTSFDEIHSGLRWYYERWLERDDLQDDLQFEIRMLLKEKSAEKGKEAFGALFDLSESGIREAASFVLLQDKRDDLQGIYAVINPSLRTDAPRGKISKTLTKDKDIIGGACAWILVDIDPIRDPKEFNTWNAKNTEIGWAHSAGNTVLNLLTLEANTIVHSGNGWQAVYPVEHLSKDDHSLILKWLDSKIQSDDYFCGRVKVDSSVSNLSRIWRLIGTHGRKMGNGNDRPFVVKSVAIRPGADREDLPRMISSNQQELEELLAEIKSNDQKQPPKIASVARYVTETTQEPPKKDGLKNGILQVVETDSSWSGRAKAYARAVGAARPAVSGQEGHNVTFALAAKLVQKFPMLDESQHWEALKIYNDFCQPPWSDEELRHKLISAQNAPRWHSPFTETAYTAALAHGLSDSLRYFLVDDTSDRGNAHRLLDKFGADLRYISTWEKWLAWDGSAWQLDIDGLAKIWFKKATESCISVVWKWLKDNEQFAKLEKGEVEGEQHRQYRKYQALAKFLQTSRNMSKLTAALASAQSEDVTLSHEKLNQRKDLLSCPNGTLDLRSGKLIPANRENLISQKSSVEWDENAACQRWEQFLGEIFIDPATGQTDHDMIGYLQRVFGCALAGRANEENLVLILSGAGGNGKSKLIEALSGVIGNDLCFSADPSFLLQSKAGQHPTSIAALYGKRLVFALEPDSGRMNTALVKMISGSDTIAARRMNEDFWNFKPECLLTISTNKKPEITETSDGIWRRLRVIEFHRQFNESTRDETLGQKLREEAQGILCWLVAGAKEYLANGLQTPETVLAATAEYRSAEDVVGSWLEECALIVDDSAVRTKAGNVQESFRRWCDRNGHHPGKSALAEGLKRLGCAKIKNSTLWWTRIKLIDESAEVS